MPGSADVRARGCRAVRTALDSGGHTLAASGPATGDGSLLNGADAFTFLALDPVDQAAETVDWQFAMSEATTDSIVAGLGEGDSLSFLYQVEIADADGATDVTSLVITLNDDGLFV